jgi:hypothetical protein
MSDATSPEQPHALAIDGSAPARPRRSPINARRRAPARMKRADLSTSSIAILLGGLVMVLVHLFFGRDDFDLPSRALAAIPLFPLLWELNRAVSRPTGTQLPFAACALLINYLTFSFASLFNTHFKDLSGPVTFTNDARLMGAAAVGLSSLSIYAGMRLGEALGRLLQPRLLRFYPPAQAPVKFSKAIGIYALMCAGITQIVSTIGVPTAIGVVVGMTFSYAYVIGAAAASPEHFRGPWSRYIVTATVSFGVATGVLTGGMENLFRLTTTVITVRWVHFRRFSVVGLAALLMAYTILQPAKAKFRAQMWSQHGSQEAPTYADRIEAWRVSIDDLWSGRDAAQSSGDQAVGRFLELDPVLHAFTLIPGRVPYAEGAAWKNILYAPIPRLFWPDKPTTSDLTRDYGIAFNLQDAVGVRSTAILLSLIVDGYWNFGWPGIVFVSVLSGLWVGVCQTMYAGEHWALQAAGTAQFAMIFIIGSFALLYAGIVQLVCGGILAAWFVYWLAKFLSPREARQRRLVGAPRTIKP